METDELTVIIADALSYRSEVDSVEVHTADGFEPCIHIGVDGKHFVVCTAERRVSVYKKADPHPSDNPEPGK